MIKYEYIRLELDMGDLGPLNRYSGDGWRVVAVTGSGYYSALLERPLPTPETEKLTWERIAQECGELAKAHVCNNQITPQD